MINKKILVFGAAGQDGSYISEILLEKKYEIYGIIKKNTDESKLIENVNYIKCDVTNRNTIDDLIITYKPDEIYNFMGVSNIFDPWSNPNETYELNFICPLNILNAIKNFSPESKFLQASSSLVFGKSKTKLQNEDTCRYPIYHYGYSKNFTDQIIKEYREEFGLFLCSAIFYNHESKKRGENFFTKKLIKQSIDVLYGKKKFVELGNIESYKDIGYAYDYMIACNMIMNQKISDDYIVSSNKSVKLTDVVDIVLKKLNLDVSVLKVDNNLRKNENLSHLVGDNSKLKSLGWRETKNLEEIIEEIILNELKIYEK